MRIVFLRVIIGFRRLWLRSFREKVWGTSLYMLASVDSGPGPADLRHGIET
ncbi:hypothetical protein RBSWK_05753 [Rhodopirellula baltica SWK14]|uniref:Uncharacterized protein n=1 Tax=Rhodopirellula baltica SWK14 TaxID=993516 RepID=L7C8C8_RHOBT|nr:hypothetical protein RBSWK_05753 [Rhodopirellula baltica SWK14]